jgi:hypothetical protein
MHVNKKSQVVYCLWYVHGHECCVVCSVFFHDNLYHVWCEKVHAFVFLGLLKSGHIRFKTMVCVDIL